MGLGGAAVLELTSSTSQISVSNPGKRASCLGSMAVPWQEQSRAQHRSRLHGSRSSAMDSAHEAAPQQNHAEFSSIDRGMDQLKSHFTKQAKAEARRN